MNFRVFFQLLPLVTVVMIVASTSPVHAQVGEPSNGGNSLLHAIGWQTFAPDPNISFGISDRTPDSNSTFDVTPVGTHAGVPGGGVYLSGIIGSGASIQGQDGAGESKNNRFLQGPTFGSSTVGSAPFGLNIVDVPEADGTFPAARQNMQEVSGSSWRFKQDGGLVGDFSIKNESDYIFRLERIHFDARSGNENSAVDLELVYLAGNPDGVVDANLIRADNGNELQNLKVILALTFDPPEVKNKTVSVAAALSPATAVRLGPGDLASFRFRWTNQWTPFAESQIDNLAISGTFGFLDPNNSFVGIDPVAVNLSGDFDGNGTLDLQDVNLLSEVIQAGRNPDSYDLNTDSFVNFDDFKLLIEDVNYLNTWIGDSNLDGQFDSSDFVTVFTAGEFEDGLPVNSTWQTGDWNSDGEFDSSDFVTAFTAGGFERGNRNAQEAVPEPSSIFLLFWGFLWGLALRHRNE